MLSFRGERVAPLAEPLRLRGKPRDEETYFNINLHYPLWLLTINAGRYCLGTVACWELITQKWGIATAMLPGDAGWQTVLATRCGIFILGWTWIGWHGFGCEQWFKYAMRRCTEGRAHGGPTWRAENEYDGRLTMNESDLGYKLWLALMPEYALLFNCKNRGKSAEFNRTGDIQLALFGGRSALLCTKPFARIPRLYVSLRL